MTKEEKILIDQMFALGEQLIKLATELKAGQSGATQAGPRKGLSEETRRKVIGRRLKTALGKR